MLNLIRTPLEMTLFWDMLSILSCIVSMVLFPRLVYTQKAPPPTHPETLIETWRSLFWDLVDINFTYTQMLVNTIVLHLWMQSAYMFAHVLGMPRFVMQISTCISWYMLCWCITNFKRNSVEWLNTFTFVLFFILMLRKTLAVWLMVTPEQALKGDGPQVHANDLERDDYQLTKVQRLRRCMFKCLCVCMMLSYVCVCVYVLYCVFQGGG
jgi:hypothetical protein